MFSKEWGIKISMVAITEMGNYRGVQKDYHREQFEMAFGNRMDIWREDDNLNEFECENECFNQIDINDSAELMELIDTEWKSYCPNICKYVEEGRCLGKHYWCGAFDEEDMN